MSNILDEYLNQIQEGYLISDKTISVNLNDFESGKKNKLLIIGPSGSGKTTIGESLSKKYKIEWISIDSLWWRLKKKYFKDSDLRDKVIHKKVEKKVYVEVIKYLKSNRRLIIEGIDLLEIYVKQPQYKKLILNQPMIILGVSSIIGGLRAGIRNQRREAEGGYIMSMYWMIEFNMKRVQPKLEAVKKDIMKLPGAKIEKYKMPKL